MSNSSVCVDSNLMLALLPIVQAPSRQIYLDVKPANTTLHLESIRALPLSTYRFSFERSNVDRVRVGVIGPELAAIIPDAVDIVPTKTLPPMEKGGSPIVLKNFPVINEQTIFMYGIGATQELDMRLEDLHKTLNEQVDRVGDLFGEVAQLEQALSISSDGAAEMRMRAAVAESKIARSEMELDIQRAKDEEEYSKAQKDAELDQIKKSEELTLARLGKEDIAARERAEDAMKMKFEANQKVERARAEAADATSAIEHERALAMQRASEREKSKTAKVSRVVLSRFDTKSAPKTTFI